MITFATLNVGGGLPQEHSNEATCDDYNPAKYIASLIDEQKIDILCLQETLMGDQNQISLTQNVASCAGITEFRELELSPSHVVTNAKMGVSVLSKYPIISSKAFMLDNPNITMISKSGNIYKSHEKGFLVTQIKAQNPICVVTGHCIPYHTFKRDVVDFKSIFSPLDDMLVNLLNQNQSVLVGADFNTTRLNLVLPQVFSEYQSLINQSTRPNGRMDDYILADKNVSVITTRVVPTCYDHYLCIGAIE